jgi:regulatory protein
MTPPRRPPPATPERLEQAGLAYLGRFAASAAQLRRVLARRVRISASLHQTDSAALLAAIDRLIARWIAAGLLNDAGYAAAKAGSLHRRGLPRQRIAGKLQEKGIAAEVIAEVLEATDEIGTDLAAAIALVRRRSLGPYRDPERRADFFQKDLGSLARAGFDRGTAHKVLKAEDPDALAAMAADQSSA